MNMAFILHLQEAAQKWYLCSYIGIQCVHRKYASQH